MARLIPHRELRNNSAEVLRAVEAGETIEVTNHGKVVAILSPPPADALSGVRFRPPLEQGGFTALPRVRLPVSTASILDELRDDR